MKNTLTVLAASFLLATGAWAKSAPSFRGELLKGGKASLDSSLKKDRLLLVSFWATWCIPCIQELTKVQEKLNADPKFPLDVLTVNIDREQRSEIPVTMRQAGFTFPVVLDPEQDIFNKYQKSGGTLPYSVLLSASKNIEAEFNGYHPTMVAEIEKAVEKLLKPKL